MSRPRLPFTPTRLVLDLFAGAGGWDVAAHDLGLLPLGVENMPAANATRRAAGLATIHDDVWTLPYALVPASVEGHITSPPCQTFAVAGKGDGRRALDTVLAGVHEKAWSDRDKLRAWADTMGDDRTGLVLTPLHYAAALLPRWLAWEQVPPVLPVWEACAEPLRNLGYHVWTGLVYSEQHGVPQTRKRAVLIASMTHRVGMPEPTHSRYYPRNPDQFDLGVEPWVSMASALSGFGLAGRPSPTVTGGGTETGGAEPIAKLARYTGRDDWQPRACVGAGITGEGRPRDVDHPAPTMTGKGTAYLLDDPASWRAGTEGLPEWTHNRPSTTVVGSFRPDVQAAPGWRGPGDGPRQNAPGSVRITVQEAGVLQSFPAWWPWQGTSGEQYLQAGNAVPPLMARAILTEAIA